MPSKVGKRSRKGKSGKRVGSSSHTDSAPQPPSHSLTDYSKFDRIDTTDSDEDSPGSMFAPPSFEEAFPTGDSCTCTQCLQRREAEAEVAARAASDSDRSHSSSNAAQHAQHAHSQPPGGFNFSKALGNAGKARGAEGKSSSKHDYDPPVFTIEGSGGDHASWMAAIDQAASSAGFLRNSTQIIPDPNAVPGPKQSNIDTPVVWDKQIYRSFIQQYLNDCDYPPMVVCNVLERFEGSTQSGEPPELAVARIFEELSIPVDPTRLDVESVQGSLKASKGKEENSKASKKKQGSPNSRQRQSHPESKPPPGMAADPEAFKAALAKHGFDTVSMRPATDADRAYMASAMRQNGPASKRHHGVHSGGALSSDDDYSSDDDLDELPELVDMKQYPVEFKSPGNVFRPPVSAASKKASSKSTAAKPPAAKPPAAKPPAAKPPAAKPPAAQASVAAAKPSTKAPSNGKPAGTAARQTAAKSTPQRVDTISDDDEDDMPDLADASDSDSDNDDMPGAVDSDNEMPVLVTSDDSDGSDDDTHTHRPPPDRPAAKPAANQAAQPAAKPAAKLAADPAVEPAVASNIKQSKQEAGRVQAEPIVLQFNADGTPKPCKSDAKGNAEASASAAKGKQVPSELAAKGTAAPAPASQQGEPMFRPVSRGPLAQYSTLLSSHTPSHDVDPDRSPSSSSTSARDAAATGTSFSFDKPSSGKTAAKQPAPPSSAQPVDEKGAHSGFMKEPTAGEIEDIVRTKGLRSAWAIAEEAKRQQMKGREASAFTIRHEDETPQQRAAKQRAADAAMQKLLEEEEQEKAEAAARAEKAKKEKQKSKKAKQKAKKKAQQDKDAKRSGSKGVQNPGPARPTLNPPPESSVSDSEEEEEPFSLHDSRFGSLLADTTAPVESVESDHLQQDLGSDQHPKKAGNPHFKEGVHARPMPQGVTRRIYVDAAPSSVADSEHDSNEDSLMRQLGGAYKHLPKMGGAGPSSEKSYSSQDTQGSSQQAGAVPVLKPGQSTLQWSQARPQAQQPASSLPNGQLQQQHQQQAQYGVRSGLLPGGPLPTPAGVALPLPGAGSVAQNGSGSGQPPLGSNAQATDPHLAEVLEACMQVVQEMDAAKAVGEKGRLFQAIKAGVAWLSSNASNPDVSDSSRQVRSKLLDARATMKHLTSRGAPVAAPPAAANSQPLVSMPGAAPSAAPPAAVMSQPMVSMPGAAPVSQRPLATAAPPLLPADLVPPAPTFVPAATSRGPTPPTLDTGRSSPLNQARLMAEQRQNGRLYQQPYRSSEAAPMDPFQVFHVQQGSSGKGPSHQPYAPNGPALEPFRYPQRSASGRGGPVAERGPGQEAGPSGRGPYQHHTAGRGHPGNQPPPPQEPYSAFRQRQAQPRPRPPLQPPGAMPVPARLSVSSQAGSLQDSEHGSTLSGSEATSPVKSSQGQHQKYVQPTPFGMPEQPSFQDDYDDDDCVVCMDAVKCTIFVPCGHSLCCRICAAKVTQSRARCPLCDIPTDGFCETQPTKSASAQPTRQQQAAVAY